MKQKQNQSLFRPFPEENPIIKKHDELCLNSNCKCEVCRNDHQYPNPQIELDYELYELKKRGRKDSYRSDYIYFLDELQKSKTKTLINFPILDTIIFTSEGSVKYIVYQEGNKLKMDKLSNSLRTFMIDRKHLYDLQYQKKKYQRNNPGFQFTQLDHQSEKLIKQFENNIKYMNSILNRVAIAKYRNKEGEESLSQHQLNTIFSRISRNIFDFSSFQYMKIFPIMCGEEEHSFKKRIKYFWEKERQTQNYKLAEHYVSYWFNKNDTLERMQEEFITNLKNNEDDYVMYLTYKLFISFKKLANKQIESAIVQYTTNDNGHSFILSNIQSLKLSQLIEVGEKIGERPKKLMDCPLEDYIDLGVQMKKTYNNFQFQYNRLEIERQRMEEKLQKDIQFSNQVYESLVDDKLEKGQNGEDICFIKQIFSNQSSKDFLSIKSKESLWKGQK